VRARSSPKALSALKRQASYWGRVDEMYTAEVKVSLVNGGTRAQAGRLDPVGLASMGPPLVNGGNLPPQTAVVPRGWRVLCERGGGGARCTWESSSGT